MASQEQSTTIVIHKFSTNISDIQKGTKLREKCSSQINFDGFLTMDY